MRWVRPGKLKLDDDLSSLFPISEADLAAIASSMAERGYDQAEPIVVWAGQDVVVDGHTRLAGAKHAGLDRVYVDERVFEDKRAALEYAVARQRDRRNLTRQQLASFVVRAMEALDRVKPRGRRTELAPIGANSASSAHLWAADQERQRAPKSAAETAEKIGVTGRQVERVRAVLASDDEAVKEDLRNGRVTINGAYRTVQESQAARQDSADPEPPVTLTGPTPQSPADKPMWSAAEWQALTVEEQALVIEFAPLTPAGAQAGFNRVNENIDWAKWSWNPVTGCLHNCDYCYARDIANHYLSQRFVPTFIPSRLHAAANMKLPAAAAEAVGWRNVFVCSMADLFGKWVPREWIDAVFAQVRGHPQWNFLFLTKFPQRLAELEWPSNAWCGTSVDRQYRVEIAERAFREVQAGIKWLSCEPLLERLTFTSLEMFDWVVIGAASKSSQTAEFQPPFEWVQHLTNQAQAAGCDVYMKPNLRSLLQEYPRAARRLVP